MKLALSYGYRILVIFFSGWVGIAFISAMFEQSHSHPVGFSEATTAPANYGLVVGAAIGLVASFLLIVHATLWWSHDARPVKYCLFPAAILLCILFFFGLAFR
jgi:hypothetical protein